MLTRVPLASRSPGARLIAPALLGAALLASPAAAGGSAENAVVIIDPAHPDALRVGNHYVNTRGVPARNVFFMRADNAANYPRTVRDNLPAFLATLEARGIADHIDYVVIAPSEYRITANGLMNDDCFPANRLSVSTVYMTARHADLITSVVDVVEPNRFFSFAPAPSAFSSRVSWEFGVASESASAHRYFVSAKLGWTGNRGNSPEELIDMIERSAAADGSFPAGTFYFMQTGDGNRSGPRHDLYPSTVAALELLGANAEHQTGPLLPANAHDCLGIMTGTAEPRIVQTDFTLVPGAFCDHLTSWAASFDRSSQEKVSLWIAKGASGTTGPVEEPCNYAGKFPRPTLHALYFQGATLGESYLRSAQFLPFQVLLYGDPLTRPFTHIPRVSVEGVPVGPVSKKVRLLPSATTTHPTAGIGRFDLLVDGVLHAVVPVGQKFVVDTRTLPDGYHELRVLAHDTSELRSTGSWTGRLEVDNRGRAASVEVSVTAGGQGTPFAFTLGTEGADVQEVRLMQQSRVVAAATDPRATVTVHGRNLGAGPVSVHAEAEFADGSVVRSAPLALDVSTDETAPPQPVAPVAYSFTRRLRPGAAAFIELPATFPDSLDGAEFTIVTAPEQAEVREGAAGAFRIVVPSDDASGTDQLVFRVTTPSGTSADATIRLVYDAPATELGLDVVSGELIDAPQARKDRVVISGTLSFPEGVDAASLDPREHSLHLEIGSALESVVVSVPKADRKWKLKRGRYQHKSKRRGKAPKYRLRIEPSKGTFSLKLSRTDLPAEQAGLIRVELRAGPFRALHERRWTVDPTSPGRRTFEAD